MNIGFSYPTGFKENLLSAKLNFATPDTFKMLVMRSGFSFSAANHQKKLNVTATTGAIDYYVVAATKTFTRAAGSFIVDGFVVGNYITTNGANAGVYVVRAVTALTMRVDLVGTATIANEGTVGAPVTFTITCRDEAVVTTGATPIDFGIVAATSTITRTAHGSGSFLLDGFVVGTVFSIDAGLNQGTYKVLSVTATVMVVELHGATVALENETNTTGATFSNGYVGDAVTPIAVTFTLDGDILTLDSFDWSDIAKTIYDSPGAIIYDDTDAVTPDAIVAYIKFSPWVLSV